MDTLFDDLDTTFTDFSPSQLHLHSSTLLNRSSTTEVALSSSENHGSYHANNLFHKLSTSAKKHRQPAKVSVKNSTAGSPKVSPKESANLAGKNSVTVSDVVSASAKVSATNENILGKDSKVSVKVSPEILAKVSPNVFSKVSPKVSAGESTSHGIDAELYGFASGYMQRKRRRELMDSPGLSRFAEDSLIEPVPMKRTRLSFGDVAEEGEGGVSRSKSGSALLSFDDVLSREEAKAEEVIARSREIHIFQDTGAEGRRLESGEEIDEVIKKGSEEEASESTRGTQVLSQLQQEEYSRASANTVALGLTSSPEPSWLEEKRKADAEQSTKAKESKSAEHRGLQADSILQRSEPQERRAVGLGDTEGSKAELQKVKEGAGLGKASENVAESEPFIFEETFQSTENTVDNPEQRAKEKEESTKQSSLENVEEGSVSAAGEAEENLGVPPAAEDTQEESQAPPVLETQEAQTSSPVAQKEADRYDVYAPFPETPEQKFQWCLNVSRHRLSTCHPSLLNDVHVSMPNSSIDANAKHLEQLIESCLLNGLSSSVVLVGDSGTGKHHTLTQVLETVSAKHPGNLIRVHLSGKIHTDDVKALREITRQLSLTDALDGVNIEPAKGSFSKHLDFLLATLGERSRASVCVAFVLDDFVEFAKQQKQLLLYNLLDLVQSKQAYKMMVIGITQRLDVVEQMEKRIKSRFEDRQVFFPRFSSTQLQQIVQKRLEISDDIMPEGWDQEKSAIMQEYVAKWNSATKKLLSGDLQKVIGRCDDDNLGAKWLLQTTHVALLNATASFLESGSVPLNIPSVGQCMNLKSLTHPELTLVASMVHLEKRRAAESYNFEMVYAEMLKFFRFIQAPVSLRRPLAMKAFERLNEIGIIQPTSRSGKSKLPKAFRHFLLKVNPEMVSENIKAGNIQCPTNLQRWVEQTFVI